MPHGFPGATHKRWVELLKIARRAVRITVIAESASLMADRAVEHSLDSAIEACDLGSGKRIRFSPGTNTGSEEGFVSVNIPQTGDQGLVQQGNFDGSACASQPVGEL